MRILNVTLYRKYRPQTFSDIAGQTFVTQAIKNSLKENKLSHAYLFNGPRGVGKTTLARLIAKGVNCTNSQNITDSPCGVCENCREITQGISMDMIEIDAASNRGIDEIRDLKEKINYQPVKGRKKIYIIDEVHMLTKEAFNALLKTLEEPPSHIIFILATTEIDKIPDTVISRCQRYDFSPIDRADIVRLLENVTSNENVNIDRESLELIYRKSEGSARDSFSILEQVISNFSGEEITIEKTQKALGVVPDVLLEKFLNLILNSDRKELLDFIDEIWEEGIVIEVFLKDFAHYLREQFKINDRLTLDFILTTISSIFFVLNEFKYEEDKKLLGYVLVYELFKDKSHKENSYKKSSFLNKESVTSGEKDVVIPKASVVKDRVATDEIIEHREEDDLNIDFFEQKWNIIRKSIRDRRVMLAALLADAYPESYEKGILNIRFPDGNDFHAVNIMELANKREVEGIIGEVLNFKIEINALSGSRKTKSEKDEFINKVISFFDGEIIEKK